VGPGILFSAPLAIPVLLLVISFVSAGFVVWEDRKEDNCGVTSRHVLTQGRVVCIKSPTGVLGLPWRFAIQWSPETNKATALGFIESNILSGEVKKLEYAL